MVISAAFDPVETADSAVVGVSGVVVGFSGLKHVGSVENNVCCNHLSTIRDYNRF